MKKWDLKRPLPIVILVIVSLLFCVVTVFTVKEGIRYHQIEIDEADVTAYAAAMSWREKNQYRGRAQMFRAAERYLKLSKLIITSEIDDPFLGKDFLLQIISYHYGDYGDTLVPPISSLDWLKEYLRGDIDRNLKDSEITADEAKAAEYLARVEAEKALLQELNADPDPDLYDYARAYYEAAGIPLTP